MLLFALAGILITPRKFSFSLSLFLGEALLLLMICFRSIVGDYFRWEPLGAPEFLGGLSVLATLGLIKSIQQKLWKHWKSLVVLLVIHLCFQFVGARAAQSFHVLSIQNSSPEGYQYLKTAWELLFPTSLSEKHYWLALGHLASLVTFFLFAVTHRLTTRKRYVSLLCLCGVLLVFALPHWFVAAFDPLFTRHIVAFCFASVLIVLVSFFRKKRELLVAPFLLSALFLISPLVALPCTVFLFLKYCSKQARHYFRKLNFVVMLLGVVLACGFLVTFGDSYFKNFSKNFSELPIVFRSSREVFHSLLPLVLTLPKTLFHYFDWGWGQVFLFLTVNWLLSGAKTSYLGLILLPIFIVQTLSLLFTGTGVAGPYVQQVYTLFSYFLIWIGLMWSALVAAAQVLRVFRFGSIDTIKRIVAIVAMMFLPWHKNIYALYVDSTQLVEAIQKSLQE